jgi:penicillin-binding protein 2
MKASSSFSFYSESRERIFRFLVLGVAILFTLRLGYLQIIRGSELMQRSEAQAIKQLTKEPYRGCIYDRNGKVMVQNSASYTLVLTPNDFDTSCVSLLANIAKMSRDTIMHLYRTNKVNRFAQIKILRDVDADIRAAIEESHELLPGVDLTIETKRTYEIKARASHLFGYRSEIGAEQIKNFGNYYKAGDLIGQTGLESSHEPFLRGIKGVQFVAVNAAGQPIENFNKGKSDLDAAEGADLFTGIDPLLQQVAEKGLHSDHGAVVVMDPRNGEVMALASSPDYDLSQFTSGKLSKEYSVLAHDTINKPLINRATESRYPPGSTWKMLMALAALQEHMIDERTTIFCRGSYMYGGRSAACHGAHGAISVQRALQVSCNVFFYELGRRMNIDVYSKYGAMFGFGQLTGIDLKENKGTLVTRDYLARRGVTGSLIEGRMVNLGIGQGEIGVTPLQMAAYCCALANKGTYYQPHIVRSYYYKDRSRMEKNAYDSISIPIEKKYFDIIHRGMYDVCNTPGGTATMVQVEGVKVCGKTGTAQNPHGKDHSWFICFAPAENPTIAICAMVENAGFGATRAAPIARDILDAYFHPDKILNPPKADSSAADSLHSVPSIPGKSVSPAATAVPAKSGSPTRPAPPSKPKSTPPNVRTAKTTAPAPIKARR